MENGNRERDGGEDIQERPDGVPEYIGRPVTTSRTGWRWPPFAIGAGFAVLVILALTWCA